MTVTVEQAYAEVERLTRERARNFSYGIRLLPKPKRRAIAAIYAFAREVDDVADDPALSIVEKRARLEALDASLDAEPGDSAMLVALADARRRYPIRGEALHALVAGGLQDTEQARYADFDELRELLPPASRARWAWRASPCTAPTSRNGPRRWGSRCS